MTKYKSPIQYVVSRTNDNQQLGLTVLINDLKIGETKVFIESKYYLELKEVIGEIKNLVEPHKHIMLPAKILGIINGTDFRGDSL